MDDLFVFAVISTVNDVVATSSGCALLAGCFVSQEELVVTLVALQERVAIDKVHAFDVVITFFAEEKDIGCGGRYSILFIESWRCNDVVASSTAHSWFHIWKYDLDLVVAVSAPDPFVLKAIA